jgi:hypothetical protein
MLDKETGSYKSSPTPSWKRSPGQTSPRYSKAFLVVRDVNFREMEEAASVRRKAYGDVSLPDRNRLSSRFVLDRPGR